MNFTENDLHAARRPIASLISKSEKALLKISSGTWQHTMLRDNLEALYIASSLINKESNSKSIFNQAQLQKAASTFTSMIKRVKDTQTKFSIGTSQHTLQRNRLKALLIGEARIRAEQGAAANP